MGLVKQPIFSPKIPKRKEKKRKEPKEKKRKEKYYIILYITLG